MLNKPHLTILQNYCHDFFLSPRKSHYEYFTTYYDSYGNSTGDEVIKLVAQSIKKYCATLCFDKPNSGTFKISISIGISSLEGRNINVQNLLNKADIALYQVKEGGRNRCCIYQVDDESSVVNS